MSPRITFEQVEQKRRQFASLLRDFVKQKGRYHNRAPELPQAKLAGCEVLNSRQALLSRLPPQGRIAEVGVGDGGFSAQILRLARPEILHLFDIDTEKLTNTDIRADLSADTPRVKLHIGDPEPRIARLPDGYLDAIYINGDHGHEAVSRDIRMAVPKLKPGGAILLHAYTTWSAVSMYHCGVARAVHEFCLEQPWKFRYLALEPMMYNDVMLVREDG